MGKLLFNEQPLVVDKELARLIGLNEAIVLQQVHYWISLNQKTNKNFYKNKYWVYNSISNWHEENFNFWSFDTVKRTFSKLVKSKILITDNFNKEKRDRTLWYSINYKTLELLKKSISANCTSALGQNAPMDKGKMHQPLPEITTENTSIYTQSINHIDTIYNIAGDKENNASKNKEIKDYKSLKQYFWDKLDVKALNITYWERKKEIEEIVLNIVEMYFKDTLVINKKQVSQELVRAALMKLTYFHIEELIHKFIELSKTTKISSPKAYIQSMIYNIAFQNDIAITNLVNFNTHKEGR